MEKQAEPEIDFGSMCDEELRQWLADKYPGRKVKRDGDEIVVTIPVNFHRRNGRQTVKAKTTDSEPDNRNNVNETLVSAITKAFAWQQELESGEYGSIEELAKAKKLGRTYVGRVLRLTSLSPSLVESVLVGDENGVSLRRLHSGLPYTWKHQNEFFRST